MSRPRFRPLRPLATAVVVLLGAQVVVHVVTIDAVLDRIELDQRAVEEGGVTWDELDAASARWASAGRWGLLLLVTTAVAWCAWQFHGQTNLVKRHVSGLRNSPGWAVGWWFVPIANLWKPFQAMSEVRMASADPQGWSRASRPRILWAWWVLWLLSGAIAWGVVGPGDPTTWEELKRSDLLDGLSSLLSIGSAASAIAIVRSTGRAQAQLRSDAVPLGGSAFPAPPALPRLPPPPPG